MSKQEDLIYLVSLAGQGEPSKEWGEPLKGFALAKSFESLQSLLNAENGKPNPIELQEYNLRGKDWRAEILKAIRFKCYQLIKERL